MLFSKGRGISDWSLAFVLPEIFDIFGTFLVVWCSAFVCLHRQMSSCFRFDLSVYAVIFVCILDVFTLLFYDHALRMKLKKYSLSINAHSHRANEQNVCDFKEKFSTIF